MNKSLLKSETLTTTFLFLCLFFVSTTFGQVTKTWNKTNGGNWSTSGNWTPSGVPSSTDHVRIPVNQSAAITRSSSDGETINLKGLTIDGNVNIQFDPGSANVCTLNITTTLDVDSGKTLTVGINNAGRLNVILASTSTSTIDGTVYMNSYSGSGYDRTFTNNGNLIITSTGVITGQNDSEFVLNSAATLQIGSTAGITTGATGNITIPGTRSFSTGANYVYNGSAAQVTGNGLPATVASLKINNAAGVTLSAVINTPILTIGDITANSIFNDGGRQITSTGTLNLTSGTFKLGAAAATTFPAFATRNIAAGTTIEYGAAVAQSVSVTPTYQNITFSGAGTKTSASGTLTVAGNWTNNSTYAHNNGTVNLNGTSQNIGGSSSTTFRNLSLSNGTKVFGIGTAISANLTIASGALANFGSIATHTAGTLTLGTLGTAAAKFGSTSTTATPTVYKNDTYFTAGTTGYITVGTSGCTAPTITFSSIPAICAGTTSFSVPYTATTGSPNLYSISGTGITTVANGSLNAAPSSITVNLSVPAVAGTISASAFTVSNSTTGCISSNLTGSVNVTAAANAGTDGALTICAGSTVTLAQLNAAITGEQAGGSWSPALAGAGTYTYTVAATSPCTTPDSSQVVVTAQAQANAGTDGTLTICAGSTVTLAQLNAAITGEQAGGSWSPALAGAGTYTYTVAATSPCTTPDTSKVIVTTQAQPNAGTDGALTICAGSTVTLAELNAAITGEDAGGSWSPTLAGAGTYTYTVNATSPCATPDTSVVIVTEQAAANAGTDGVYTICSGTDITLAQLNAAITGEDAGGSWSPALAGAGTYTYTVAATSPCTAPDTSVVVVSAVSCQPAELSNCGNTPVLTSVNARIFVANTVTQSTKYRYRVAVSTAPSTYFYCETIYPSFRLTDVVGLTPAYGITYNVEIQNEFLLSGNTVSSAYGNLCTVSTQAANDIAIAVNQCGQTLAAVNSKVYVNGIAGATMYTYRIAKQSEPTTYSYIETPYSNFRLTYTPTSGSVAIEHNTKYIVAVSVTTPSGVSDFNSPCLVATPVGPATTIQGSQCGDDDNPYVIATSSTKVYAANLVSGATYTFKLEQYNGNVLVDTNEATSPINYFNTNMFTGDNALLPDTNYHVYVRINYFGEGDYDHDCVVRTPVALKNVEMAAEFKALAYPNPFANNFMIDVKSASESAVSLKVYDMIGRLIDQREVRMSDLETTTIGDNYPTGVYNVIVSQENSTQIVRVVKR